jgi:hypothetical protein
VDTLQPLVVEEDVELLRIVGELLLLTTQWSWKKLQADLMAVVAVVPALDESKCGPVWAGRYGRNL